MGKLHPTSRAWRKSIPTEREMQVLELAAEGLTNAEIAQVLGLSEETVKTHVRMLLSRMNARSRTHLVHIAHLNILT